MSNCGSCGALLASDGACPNCKSEGVASDAAEVVIDFIGAGTDIAIVAGKDILSKTVAVAETGLGAAAAVGEGAVAVGGVAADVAVAVGEGAVAVAGAVIEGVGAILE